MSRRNTFLTTIFLNLAVTITLLAQTEPAITVSGEVSTPVTFKKTDLAAFKIHIFKAKDRDGKEHEFSGVALSEILKKAGVTNGSQLRGENLAKYVILQAADGYEVLFSLPEIDPEFTSQVILLATQKDGKDMANGEGPFRIIVPNDKKQARWIREVRAIKVSFAKE